MTKIEGCLHFNSNSDEPVEKYLNNGFTITLFRHYSVVLDEKGYKAIFEIEVSDEVIWDSIKKCLDSLPKHYHHATLWVNDGCYVDVDVDL